MKTALILITTIVIVIYTGSSGAIALDLIRDGNVQTIKLETESGVQFFASNSGLLEGANKAKIFERPPLPFSTTLWGDKRRTECYEHSIRLMAQMASAFDLYANTQNMQGFLRALGLGAKTTGRISGVLDSFHTNYVSGETLPGEISNEISSKLRDINPKTMNGVKVPCTNLKYLGKVMFGLGLAFKATDMAVGAALQEALAGDLALGRLQVLQDIFNARQQAGVAVDPAIFKAMDQARANLIRSEDYWGALVTELSDRSSEICKIAVEAGIREVQKDAARPLTKYYSRNLGAKAAATKASSVAGLWAFSLIATYETIDALLDQHKKAQVSVTSATLSCLLREEMNKKRAPADDMVKAMSLQAEYSYYD